MNFCLAYFWNDLWMYDGENWTWISGISSPNQYSFYGEKGVASPSNVPGSRRGATGWRDNDGNLWMFGGWGYTNASSYGIQNTMNNAITYCKRCFQ
jgi:hypothetical protein